MSKGDVAFGTEGFYKTPLGKATQIVINIAVELIASKLRGLPFQCSVIKLEGEDVYLSAAQKTGTSTGDVFSVYTLKEELVDPETGELLGSEEEKVATVKIHQVKENFSKAKIVSCNREIKRGDIARHE